MTVFPLYTRDVALPAYPDHARDNKALLFFILLVLFCEAVGCFVLYGLALLVD